MSKIIKKLLVTCILSCMGLTIAACSKDANQIQSQEEVQEDNLETNELTPEEESTEPEAEADTVEALEEEIEAIDLEDGDYLAEFNTDSTMFHVNEAWDGKGILTVRDGKASIHIVLVSKSIQNLFEGTVDTLDESKLLEPTVEAVTYSDGLTEDVNAFDVNVPYLDKEFDLALIGKKGVWYDHKVSVSNPVPYTGEESSVEEEAKEENQAEDLVKVTLTGGSGKSTVDSPAKLSKNEEGQQIVTITWSSPHYDYMIVDGEKLLPVNTEGNSVFEIPVSEIPLSIDVVADTVAMSKPHEIEYNLSFETLED